MARSLDSNIYGMDDNSFADSISSDALGAPSPGNVIDQSARSVGSKGKRLDGTEEKFPIASEPNPEVRTCGIKGDGRAATKGNHGKQD